MDHGTNPGRSADLSADAGALFDQKITGTQLNCDSRNETMKPDNSARLFLFFLLSFCFCASAVLAQENRDRNTKKAREAAAQSERAARVFNEIMGNREKSIHQE